MWTRNFEFDIRFSDYLRSSKSFQQQRQHARNSHATGGNSENQQILASRRNRNRANDSANQRTERIRQTERSQRTTNGTYIRQRRKIQPLAHAVIHHIRETCKQRIQRDRHSTIDRRQRKHHSNHK